MISKLQPKIFPGHWNPFIKLSNVKGVYLKNDFINFYSFN